MHLELTCVPHVALARRASEEDERQRERIQGNEARLAAVARGMDQDGLVARLIANIAVG